MHIIIIPTMYPNHYNPVSNIFFRDQAEALARWGYKVGVIAIVPITIQQILKKKILKFGLRVFKEKGVVTFLFSFPMPPRAERLNQFIRKRIGLLIYKKYEKQYGIPDLQHVHTFISGGLAIEIEKKYGIPFVVTEHSSTFLVKDISKYRDSLANTTYHKSKINIAVSFSYANFLTNRFSSDFEYIPNIVDVQYFVPDKNIRSKDTIIKILNIANMNSNKQQSLLLNAFNTVVQRFIDVVLIIGGDGPEKKFLEKKASDLGIMHKIRFLGKLSREQVRNEMQSSDVFVLTSNVETFGVVLIEAMACGKPVVSTKSGGPESIITSSEYGELVDHSIESIAKGLIKVISNIKSYDGNYIRQNVVNNFSDRVISERLVSIYKKVCNYRGC